jgi:hypothetical protein
MRSRVALYEEPDWDLVIRSIGSPVAFTAMSGRTAQGPQPSEPAIPPNARGAL